VTLSGFPSALGCEMTKGASPVIAVSNGGR
jgi:hypothetical protein